MSTFDAAEGDGVGIVNHRSDSYLMGRRETCLHEGYRATDSEDARGSVGTPRIEEDRRRDSGGGRTLVVESLSIAGCSGESAPTLPDCDRPPSSSSRENAPGTENLVFQT